MNPAAELLLAHTVERVQWPPESNDPDEMRAIIEQYLPLVSALNRPVSLEYSPKERFLQIFRLKTEGPQTLFYEQVNALEGETYYYWDELNDRIAMFKSATVLPLTRSREYWENFLRQHGHEWLVGYQEWAMMWQMLDNKLPSKPQLTATVLGMGLTRPFALLEAPNGDGCLVLDLGVNWKKAPKFNHQIILAVEAQPGIIAQLYAQLVQRYRGQRVWIECKHEQSAIWKQLGLRRGGYLKEGKKYPMFANGPKTTDFIGTL